MSDAAPADDAPTGEDAEPALAGGGPFDLNSVRDLLHVMQRFDVTEIDLKNADQTWHVRRGAVAPVAAQPAAAPPPAPMTVAAAAPAAPAAPTAPAAPPAGKTIDSPTVGTFYGSPSPEDPAFIKVGDSVSPDTVVCLVEAMKVFNQIQAETSGTIAEILVKNGDAVEFGQPLFRLA